MSIPEECTVLVVGGGPSGSYSAAALAREGVNVVLLEADVFPRYHIGESMIASIRHFLRFIDLDKTFDAHGFTKKPGAAFKLNKHKREGYTDFLIFGEDNYAWNVVRSESDELMFRHAEKSGAKVFDGVKVNSIEFTPPEDGSTTSPLDPTVPNPGKPVSASWTNKTTGASGSIKFTYLVDASGRAGLVNAKYTKNRRYNKGLKNIANWGYYKGAGAYGEGTRRANSPVFEALHDESGWAWVIPLHNGTTSIGIVMNQEIATGKKKNCNGTKEFFDNSLKLAPTVGKLLENAELVSDIKSTSDFSYNSSSYALPYVRVIGDAGCFIDPFFSSGVHLALSSGLSSAITICASIKGQCDELTAAKWHSAKVTDGYERFRLVVLSAYRQMRLQDEHILSDFDEDSFDKAFNFFRPIIQGTADTSEKLTYKDIAQTLDFCANAFEPTAPEDRDAVLAKITPANGSTQANIKTRLYEQSQMAMNANLTEEEKLVVQHLQARNLLRTEDTMHINNFSLDVVDGLAPKLERGSLGLVAPASA